MYSINISKSHRWFGLITYIYIQWLYEEIHKPEYRPDQAYLLNSYGRERAVS